jgi:hypothetical protein
MMCYTQYCTIFEQLFDYERTYAIFQHDSASVHTATTPFVLKMYSYLQSVKFYLEWKLYRHSKTYSSVKNNTIVEQYIILSDFFQVIFSAKYISNNVIL